jgi:hypothetical protein
MEMETLMQANKLVATIREIKKELEAWDETTKPSHLGMKQHWNGDHLIELPCKHSPTQAFEAYRNACINALKVRLAEVEAEIAAL